jgi:DNA-binding MarR family transcriptional regulator
VSNLLRYGDAVADVLDDLTAQWRRQRPDLDVSAMATIGRLNRFLALAAREIEATLDHHDLRIAEFDVLAAIRRLGKPYVTTPTALTNALMLSPAGMTARLDRLERAGYVERRHDPDDRRSLLVALTSEGLATIDAAVTDHVATEDRLLDALSSRQRTAIDSALRTLLRQFD